MASSVSLAVPREDSRTGIFLRPPGNIGHLLFARILVVLNMQCANLKALQIAQQRLVLLQAKPISAATSASPGGAPGAP